MQLFGNIPINYSENLHTPFLRRKIIPQLMRKLQKYCINIQVLAIIKEGTQIRIQYIFDYEMSIIEENIELQISEKTLITSKEIVIKLYRILNPNIKGVLDKIKELGLEDLIPKEIIKHLESNFPSGVRKLFFWGEEEKRKIGSVQ